MPISAKVSGDYHKYSRFGDTRAGDEFRSRLPPDRGTLCVPVLRFQSRRIGNLSSGLPREGRSQIRHFLHFRSGRIGRRQSVLPREAVRGTYARR
jgi:hypothetical protein